MHSFLRLNISLPYLEEVIDLDGFTAREDLTDEGQYEVAVRFHEISRHAETLILTFIRWFELQQQLPAPRVEPTAPPAPRVKPARALRPSAQKQWVPGRSVRPGASSTPRIGSTSWLGDHAPSTPIERSNTAERAVVAVPEKVVQWTDEQDLGALYRAALDELAVEQKKKRKKR
ncbi:MAG: hypothetical protein JRH20_27040 [Deltaproteobacteria bacterium]|nr:hypothetical protein [Deltaproteobacteria bacterium]